MQEKMILTVSQANRYIKQVIDGNPNLNNILIKGEISNFKLHSSGHMYMSLKDDGGVMRAIMFKSAAAKLVFKPENGMRIIAGGRITVYERDGQYQLYIDSMQPDGVGALHMAYEQLKEKLRIEGLFNSEFKKQIPRFPKRIAVVTAPTGAAIRDILNILSRRFPHAEVVVCPVLVQGAAAAPSIAAAIEYLSVNKLADVMIVGRGGGSIEDLWAFNEELVARAVFASEIPVISAVGHEVDFTIVDFVADLRAPTPSAAAELAVPDQNEIVREIKRLEDNMKNICRRIVENYKLRILRCADVSVMRNPIMTVNENRIYLDNIYKHFENAYKNALGDKRQRFKLTLSRLNGLNPLDTLSRGFSMVKDAEGRVVKSVGQISRGDKLLVVLRDGEVFVSAE